MEKQYLFYVFLGIFSLTAIITLLGITGVLKSIKSKYLNVLFTSLILEVVAAVVLLFNSTNILDEAPQLNDLIYQAEGVKVAEADAFSYLVSRLKAPKMDDSKVDSLRQLLLAKEAEIEGYKGELSQLNRSFYTKIYKLKRFIYDYGNFINIAYNPSDKEQVYLLLKEIFESLQVLPVREELSMENIRSTYRQFKMGYFQAEDVRKYEYVFQSDLLHFIQAYLDLSKDEG